jgi:hypothetical protein
VAGCETIFSTMSLTLLCKRSHLFGHGRLWNHIPNHKLEATFPKFSGTILQNHKDPYLAICVLQVCWLRHLAILHLPWTYVPVTLVMHNMRFIVFCSFRMLFIFFFSNEHTFLTSTKVQIIRTSLGTRYYVGYARKETEIREDSISFYFRSKITHK